MITMRSTAINFGPLLGVVFTGRVVLWAPSSINRAPVDKAQISVLQVTRNGTNVPLQDLGGASQSVFSCLTNSDGFYHICCLIPLTSASGLGNTPAQYTFNVSEGDPVRKANGTSRFTPKQVSGTLVAVASLNTVASGQLPTLASPEDAGAFAADLWTGFQGFALPGSGFGASNSRFSSRSVVIHA